VIDSLHLLPTKTDLQAVLLAPIPNGISLSDEDTVQSSPPPATVEEGEIPCGDASLPHDDEPRDSYIMDLDELPQFDATIHDGMSHSDSLKAPEGITSFTLNY
jgi:hypothetical protein